MTAYSADSLAGRVNALVAATLGCDPGRVLPGARLREDLGGHPLSLMRLAVLVECELGLEPVMFSRPEESWACVGDVLAWAERAGRAA